MLPLTTLEVSSALIVDELKSMVILPYSSSTDSTSFREPINLFKDITKNFAECPVACHGDECMPCTEGYKGGVKSPLSL